MGGSSGFESALGIGSTFWAELEGDQDYDLDRENPAAAPTNALIEMATRPCLILCIEDNPVNLLIIRRIVQQQPEWELLSATTGEKGFALALEACPD